MDTSLWGRGLVRGRGARSARRHSIARARAASARQCEARGASAARVCVSDCRVRSAGRAAAAETSATVSFGVSGGTMSQGTQLAGGAGSGAEAKPAPGTLVLRVDQDSDSDLQALFDSVLKPDSSRPLQVPLRMRQLPKSFFQPPSTGSKSSSVSHSRENSADSAFGSGAAVGGGGAANAPVGISHSRAHSSPASLQQTYAAGGPQSQQQQQQQAQPQQHRHVKQRSYDVASLSHDEALGPLPPGWEQACTPEGQVYYLK